MATCPNCHHYFTPMEIMTQPPFCPQCHKKVQFNRKEYKKVARPGLYIAVVFFFNMIITVNPMKRLFLNLLLMALWFAFFKRYLEYLKQARMEIDEEDQ